jgi:hypothetical protein
VNGINESLSFSCDSLQVKTEEPGTMTNFDGIDDWSLALEDHDMMHPIPSMPHSAVPPALLHQAPNSGTNSPHLMPSMLQPPQLQQQQQQQQQQQPPPQSQQHLRHASLFRRSSSQSVPPHNRGSSQLRTNTASEGPRNPPFFQQFQDLTGRVAQLEKKLKDLEQ